MWSRITNLLSILKIKNKQTNENLETKMQGKNPGISEFNSEGKREVHYSL